MTIYLSDLDGVGTDWDHPLDFHAQSDAYKHLGIPPRHERTDFSFYDLVSPDVRAGIMEILNREDYYRDLPEIEGWAAAMNELLDLGHEVFIVTTPWWDTYHCAGDKIDWVARIAGERFRKRVVLTGDKTIVHGDFLIDDKPTIHGANQNPTWERIVFDQHYNKQVTDRRIMNWTDGSWRAVLGLLPVAS